MGRRYGYRRSSLNHDDRSAGICGRCRGNHRDRAAPRGERAESSDLGCDRDGNHQTTWTNTGSPFGMERRDGKTYLADGKTGDIRILDKDGKILSQWNAEKIESKDLPHWLTVDSRGNIYVAYVNGKRLQKWVP